MKNKMNCGCCDPEQTKVCSICGSSGCALTGEANKYIIDQEHPDAALPGFTSSGRVRADFSLFNREASFAIVLDYADDADYYAVSVSIDQDVTDNNQVILRIEQVNLGVHTVIDERRAYLGAIDVLFHQGHLCVSWSSSGIFATVEWTEGLGFVIESVKSFEFNSGRAAFLVNDSSVDSFGYFRAPGDETDEGICPSCDVAAPVGCSCCPDGIALAWELDFSAAAINNEGWVECDQIPGVYILDRIPNVSCAANYSQLYTGEYIDQGCTGGSYRTTVAFRLGVGIGEGECELQLVMTINPDPNAPCAFTGIYASYGKRFTSVEEACSGTHVLEKRYDRFPATGFGWPCSGSIPATVTVTSIA